MADLRKNPQYFRRILLKWNREINRRGMPWKGEKDPYKIWLSEVILQQTRVEQGLGYYQRFIKAFPDIHQLAAAPGKKVFKLWEGLGYYTRCRNVIAAARFVSKEKKGLFPETYEEIRSLPGVGPYTAAAIASFAYNLPHAVVDGNVYRVLARVFGISMPIDSTEGKKKFAELASRLLDKKQPGVYNQSIMDFGALVCKPVPTCDDCVFKKSCFAFLNKKVTSLPVKEKKISLKKRWFYYLVIEHRGETALRIRTGKDIWQQLYEYPLVETGSEKEIPSVLASAEETGLLKPGSYKLRSVSPFFKQQLSHQLITGRFLRIELEKEAVRYGKWLWSADKKIKNYPLPKLINQYRATAQSQGMRQVRSTMYDVRPSAT